MKDFIFLHTTELVVLALIFAVIINLILKFSWTKKLIIAVIDDTLKVNDGVVRRFSGTKITMLTAFGSVLWSFHYITVKYGFNEVAFGIMACISTGVAITGAYSKKINPPVETTTKEKEPIV